MSVRAAVAAMVGKQQGPAGSIPPAGAKSPRANRQAQHRATNPNHRIHEIHQARKEPRRGRVNERGRRPLGRRDRKSQLVARFGHNEVHITSARRKVNVASALPVGRALGAPGPPSSYPTAFLCHPGESRDPLFIRSRASCMDPGLRRDGNRMGFLRNSRPRAAARFPRPRRCGADGAAAGSLRRSHWGRATRRGRARWRAGRPPSRCRRR